MELLQSQAPADRELSESSASARHGTSDIGHWPWDIVHGTLCMGHGTLDIDMRQMNLELLKRGGKNAQYFFTPV